VRVRVAVILVVGVATLLAGCGGGGGGKPKAVPATVTVASTVSPTTTTTEAQTADGLKAAALVVLGTYAGGNWGAFWDHWDPASQALITRVEYIRRKTACPGITGSITVVSLKSTPSGIWNVQGRRGGSVITYQFRYNNGAWDYVVTDATVKAQLLEPYASYIARPGCTK
jgi:hypothetical protein